MIDKRRNRQAVSIHLADRLHYVVNHLDKLCRSLFHDLLGLVDGICPVSRNVDLNERGSAGIDSLLVHFDYLFALLHELLSLFLHVSDGILNRKHLGQCEEGRLKNGVCTLAETDLCGKIYSVDGVKLNVVLCYVSLCVSRHMLVELFRSPLTVDEEHAARLYVVDHLVALCNV